MVLKSVTANSDSSDAKIQIGRVHGQSWRDNGFVLNNPESVQNALLNAKSAYPDVDVRAVDGQGRMVDFR